MANANKSKQEKKKGLITARLETLSPTHPIPFEGGKAFSYLNDTEYLPFLAPDDRYAKLLLQARLLSCTGNACVTTKKDYCAGDGFQTWEEDEIKDKKLVTWFESINSYRDNITEVNRQIFESHFTFGNTPIEIIRYNYKGKKYFYVCPHNFLEWRLCRPNPTDGKVYSAIQSKIFLQEEFVLSAEDYEKAVRLPIYNPQQKEKKARKYRDGINWLVDENGVERTLLWYKQSTSGFMNYGLPSNSAGVPYEILEYKGARFNIDELENNAIIGGIFHVIGSVSETELTKIGRRFVNMYTGDGKRGRIMVTGSEEESKGSQFHEFKTKKEGSYKESDEHWVAKIILANKWDSVLAGIVQASTMNKGVSFLAKVLEIKKNTVIIPAQKDLMEKVWVPILDLAKEWIGFSIDPRQLQIKNAIDISGITDVDITPAVTVDEVREAKGLPELEDKKKGKMLLGELGAEQKKGVYVADKSKKKSDVVPEE
jgi:hypothetical protein